MTARSVGALRLRLSTLASDLHEAKADADLYARLKGAAERVKEVQAECNAAMSDLRKAEIADEKEQREARYRGLSDIEVVEVPDKEAGGLLRSTWRISYTASAFDGYSSKPTRLTKNGFEELEPHVRAYLIEQHPERIPASIMALAPDDPAKAIGKLLAAKRRGFFSEKAA